MNCALHKQLSALQGKVSKPVFPAARLVMCLERRYIVLATNCNDHTVVNRHTAEGPSLQKKGVIYLSLGCRLAFGMRNVKLQFPDTATLHVSDLVFIYSRP